MLFVVRVTGNVLPGEPGALRFSGLNTGYNMMGWIKRYAASGSSDCPADAKKAHPAGWASSLI
ncbi:hypothetical protein N0B36_20420 [Citrobacter sp. XY323]|uniref:hypothetical protein n=1 Tax=Citrobacter sp. XY323 TaxID=2976537 RepID=UPI00218207B0|nr:hypothetical protein [Citrobacter sp. XY323]MCS8553812.1 hypothetical protein [Citrobacter sp. XY323]